MEGQQEVERLFESQRHPVLHFERHWFVFVREFFPIYVHGVLLAEHADFEAE